MIVKSIVATVSQPAALVPVHVYIPEDVYVFPFQFKLSHDEIAEKEDEEELIVRFKVTKLSQPTLLVSTQEYVPDEVYVLPFQL